MFPISFLLSIDEVAPLSGSSAPLSPDFNTRPSYLLARHFSGYPAHGLTTKVK
jgi:hypothetical protein